MWAILTAIPSLLSGLFGTVNGITNAIANERLAQISAKTDQERIQSEERIRTLTARRDVMIAEASVSKLNIIMRTVIACGPASILLKIFLYDKVIGSLVGCAGPQPKGACPTFVTDPLDDNLWRVVSIVVGFYFLAEMTSTAARIIKR
jgi:hypothetical protein